MPATDYQGSSASFGGFGRSILSFRRDQNHSMDASHEASSMELDLDSFQKQVTDRFLELSSVRNDDLLSLSWILKLLDAFLSCQEEFRSILFTYRSQIVKPPMDRLIADYLDRSVKTLDVCNAVRDGIDQLRQWQKLLEIVLIALNDKNNRKTLGEGQFRRAKKALVDLAIIMLDDKDSNPAFVSHRNRSFGRHNASRDHRSSGHSRSLSWSVSRTWSAAKQLQAMGNNLAYPRASDLLSTNGLAAPVYTMNLILLFVTWALVAAIPCQDRGLQVHFSVPRQFSWGAPMIALHDRIMEESKKRERKNSCGLLKEIHHIEKCTRVMNEQLEFALTEENEEEVKLRVEELSNVCDAMKAGLDPLERQVREVFRRIVRSRTEGNSLI